MATLQDLLDLLPDNDTGEIDAADLRTIVTALYDMAAQNAEDIGVIQPQIASIGAEGIAGYQSLDARVAALEAGGGDSQPTVQAQGRWQVNATAGSVPGGKQVSAESGQWALATWLRFDPTDLNNNNLRNALLATTEVYGQQQSEARNWIRFTVTGDAADHGTYIEVPVAYFGGQGGIAAAQWQESFWVFTVPYQEV